MLINYAVDVCGFEDCFALLDGSLKQLTTFFVNIDDFSSSIDFVIYSHASK